MSDPIRGRLDRLGIECPPMYAALRAVLDLHAPGRTCEDRYCTDHDGCVHCQSLGYPCHTVRVITEHLGVTDVG